MSQNCRIGSFIGLLAIAVSAAAAEPSLVGVWARTMRTDNGGKGTFYLNISSDGTFKATWENETTPRNTGTFSCASGKYEMHYDQDNSDDSGTVALPNPNELHFTNSSGTSVYRRTVAFMAVPPAATPLRLRANERSPRQLVKDRATAELRLYHSPHDAAELDQAEQLVEAGHIADALPLLRKLAPVYADDAAFLWVDAAAKLAGGDAISARLEYDELLLHRPDVADAYLGRALAAGQLGSIQRMKADLRIARSLDPGQADAFERQHGRQLAAFSGVASTATSREICQKLIQAASTGADVESLVPLALELHKSVNATRRVPQELYQDGLRAGIAGIEVDPNDPQAWAAVADYLYSNSMRKYGLGNVNGAEWVNDRTLAMRFADQALHLDRTNLTALSVKGWLLEQDNQEQDALNLAQNALLIAPGYPRLVRLESILLNVSSIRASNAAARDRSIKYGTSFVPGWIIHWSRGPTGAELEQARQFDAMSASNLNQADRDMLLGWQRYRNSIAEMNVAASYYAYVGQADRALELWNRILKIDPGNGQALENLEDYDKKINRQDEVDELELRLQNLYTTTARPLTDRATRELIANDFAAAQKDLEHALEIDPSDSLVYGLLGRVAAKAKGPEAWWTYARCGEALEIAGARLHGVDVTPNATTPVSQSQVQGLLQVWTGELQTAQHDQQPALAQHYQALIEAMNRRLVAAPSDIANLQPGVKEFDRRRGGPGTAALENALLRHINVLVADTEMDAAARCCLSAPNQVGKLHYETYGPAVDVEYPVYLYLRPRLYHFQLWHYFGPGTLLTYEGYSRQHPTVDPANPPSRLNHPNVMQ